MATLSLLRASLARKMDALNRAELRLRSGPADATAWLRNRLADRAFVLFCGAGISVSPPSSAPAFLELRTTVMLALTDLLVERRVVMQENRLAVEVALEQLDT